MANVITCPSGLSGRVRGMKVREERVLADRKLAKSGGQIDELLGSCWEETLDPGALRLRRGRHGRLGQGAPGRARLGRRWPTTSGARIRMAPIGPRPRGAEIDRAWTRLQVHRRRGAPEDAWSARLGLRGSQHSRVPSSDPRSTPLSYERWPGELDRSRSPDVSSKPVRPVPQELSELGPLRRVQRGVDP